MQATSKELYKEVSTSTGRELALVKSVGDAVFQGMFFFTKHPESLIFKVKGLGYWHMRKKKLDNYIHKYYGTYTGEYISDDEKAMREFLNNKRQFQILLERQKEYDVYLEKREKIKEIRYKTQPFLIPKNQEEC